MIKPLLRVLPSLSGNVKLACSLVDVSLVEEETLPHSPAKTWEANIRGAQIQPLSKVLHQRAIPAALLSSSWEYDIQKYYKLYSDTFFKTCFDYDKTDFLMVDKHASQPLRAQDFEWGASRISLGKNNDQLSFFAPFYIDSAEDIPAYFLISVTIHTGIYDVTRKLRINIASNGESKDNYIYRYLYKYCSQLDDNVIFCTPLTNQATYYGIDLAHGGFVRAVDNMAERLYHRQNTIQNFDASIVKGWEHNKIAMKQIIPMCFNFTIQDFLTEQERVRYKNLPCDITGEYYSTNGKKLVMHDFLTDYEEYSHDIMHMNDVNGLLVWGAGNVNNIMDVGFPSLNDRRYIKYEFSNKLDPWYCRWKLKLSDDEHPYVTNMSWAFSKNQNSNYRYGSYPSTYNSIQSLATCVIADSTYNYSLRLPLGHDYEGTGMHVYKHLFEDEETGFAPYAHLVSDYKKIIEWYCTNWFSTIAEYSEKIYDDEGIWKDVIGDCVYYNGILYDLRNIYDRHPDGERVDKFAVIMRPVLDLYDEKTIGELTFTDYTLYRKNIGATKPNVVSDETVVDDIINATVPVDLFSDIRFDDGQSKTNTDEIVIDEIFIAAGGNDGDYVDILDMSYISEDGAYHRAISDYYDMTTAWLADDFGTVKTLSDDIAGNIFDRLAYGGDEELADVIAAMKAHYGNIKPEYAYSYLQLPIYTADGITYDSAYVLDDFGYVDGTSLSPLAYSYYHNESVIALEDPAAAYMQLAVGYLQEVTYIHHNGDDKHVMSPSKAMMSYVWHDDEGHEHIIPFSYLSVHSPQMNEIVYGSSIYVKAPFVLASYNGWWGSDFSLDALDEVEEKYDWDASELAYWNSWCHAVKADIASYVKESLTTTNSLGIHIKEYEYVPVQVFGGEEVASNIMKERCRLTGRMYGDKIHEEDAQKDFDVLWVDPYNLDALLKAAGKVYNPDALKTMFVKILNKTHLFYYYAELYKDAYRNRIDDWSTSEWYKELYVVEKKLVYDVTEDSIPEVKTEYTPLARWLNFPEFYSDGKKDAGSEFRSFIKFYNELWYDAEEDLFSLVGRYDYSLYDPSTDSFGVYSPRIEKYNGESHRSGRRPEEDYTPIKFELAFKKDMYRADKDLWDASEMSGDLADYRDIYFYRVQSALEHDQKYGSIKKIGFIGNRKAEEEAITEAATYTYLDTYVFTDAPEWDLLDDTYSYNFIYEPDTEKLISIDVRGDQTTAYFVSYAYFMDDVCAILTDDARTKKLNHDGYYTEDISYETGVLCRDSKGGEVMRPSPRDISNGQGWNDLVLDTESLLVPLFNDVFVQPASEALIYAHYTLHDISEAHIVKDIDPVTGEEEQIATNYRFNKNAKTMMVKLSEKEKQDYKFVHTYNKYDNCYAELAVAADDLGYGDQKFSTYIAPDGTKYGFYMIDSHVSNTSNAFKVSGITPDMIVIDKLKYFKYINSTDITSNPKYIAAIYKNLLPFIKQQPLAAMDGAKAMLVPQTYQIPLIYSQQLHDTSNGSSETDIKMHPDTIKTIELLRYFHGITPLIVPTTEIKNQWNIKLKDVSKTMVDTGKHISIGDSVIGSQKALIYNPMSFPVYTPSTDELLVKDYNNISWQYVPLEYKHYMSCRHILLDPVVKIGWHKLVDYSTMLSIENEEMAFEQFKKAVNSSLKNKWDDDSLKFMISKYRVRWESVPSGLDHTRTKKLYKLTTIFELI